MDWIEQAVFTSAETDHAAGYHLVATSPGVCTADARHLAGWGPSHGSLLHTTPDAQSLNFHPLPSGAYCVSCTSAAGWEYSRRGGARVYTQCLLVTPTTLARFANDPFAVLRAARASGTLTTHDPVPAKLDPVRLAGHTPPTDAALLARLAVNPGPEWIAALVQACLISSCLAVTGGPSAEPLVAGILNCFPPALRTELTFSTALRFSPRRPFRLIGLDDDREERRRLERLYDMTVLDLDRDPPSAFLPIDPWPRLIHRVLKSGRTTLLAHHFAAGREGLSAEDLSGWGLELLEELDASASRPSPTCRPRPGHPPGSRAGRPSGLRSPEQAEACQAPPPQTPSSPAAPRIAHAAHRPPSHRRSGSTSTVAPPSTTLHPDDRLIVEKLERLDDLVFDAIAGDPAAMDGLKRFWPRIRQQLGDQLLEESREQYLRYAMTVWEESADAEATREPSGAVQALDVLCILFDAA